MNSFSETGSNRNQRKSKQYVLEITRFYQLKTLKKYFHKDQLGYIRLFIFRFLKNISLSGLKKRLFLLKSNYVSRVVDNLCLNYLNCG